MMRPRFVCPMCGSPNDAATNVGDGPAAPAPGDVLVCIDCATPAVLGEDGTLTPAPREVREDPDVKAASRAVAIARLFGRAS